VRSAVDDQRAGAADALAAVGVEGDGALLLVTEALVELIEHLEEGRIGVDALDLEGLEAARLAFIGTVELTPDLKGEVHL